MILLVRNSLGELSTVEAIISMVVVAIYVAVAFKLASKMFDLGALMYNRRPSLKEVVRTIRK